MLSALKVPSSVTMLLAGTFHLLLKVVRRSFLILGLVRFEAPKRLAQGSEKIVAWGKMWLRSGDSCGHAHKKAVWTRELEP